MNQTGKLLGAAVFIVAIVGALALGAAVGRFTHQAPTAAKVQACPDAAGRCTCPACCCPGGSCTDAACCKPVAPGTDTIVLRSPNGKHSLILRATDQGAGIWLQHDGLRGPMVAIYSLDDQNGIGIYANASKSGPMAIALGVDAKGEGGIQLRDSKGNVRWLTPHDIDRMRRLGDKLGDKVGEPEPEPDIREKKD